MGIIWRKILLFIFLSYDFISKIRQKSLSGHLAPRETCLRAIRLCKA
jgi:hypothetical protein